MAVERKHVSEELIRIWKTSSSSQKLHVQVPPARFIYELCWTVVSAFLLQFYHLLGSVVAISFPYLFSLLEDKKHGCPVDCVRKHMLHFCFHYHVENEILFSFPRVGNHEEVTRVQGKKRFISALCLTGRIVFYFLVSREGNGEKQNSSYSRENVISYEEKKQILFDEEKGMIRR